MPTIGFAMAMYSVYENATTLGVVVQGTVAETVQVAVTSEDGTAVGKHVLVLSRVEEVCTRENFLACSILGSEDFEQVNTALTFNPNTPSQVVKVHILDNSALDGEKRFYLRLAVVGQLEVVLSPETVSVVIVDDEMEEPPECISGEVRSWCAGVRGRRRGREERGTGVCSSFSLLLPLLSMPSLPPLLLFFLSSLPILPKDKLMWRGREGEREG